MFILTWRYRKYISFNTLLAKVRSRGEIALAMASSGIAALLLNGGRTVHSRMKIPLSTNEYSVCGVRLLDSFSAQLSWFGMRLQWHISMSPSAWIAH